MWITAKFEVFMAVDTKIRVIWDVMQCSLVDRYQSFRGTSYFHLQDSRFL
jgi:hypothetical protein